MSSRLVSLLARFVLFFEPLTPGLVSFFLSRKLNEWKAKRLINDYEDRIERIGEFHYKIHVNLVMTQEQARNVLWNFLAKTFRKKRR